MSIGSISAVIAIATLSFSIESVVGFGGSILAVTVLSLILPANHAVALVPFFAIIASSVVLTTGFRSVQIRSIVPALLWSVPGLVGGSFLLSYLPGYAVRVAVSALTIAYALSILLGTGEMRLPVPAPLAALIAGLATGVSSIAILYVPVVLSNTDDKSSVRASLAVLWISLVVIRGPIFLARDMLPDGSGTTILLALPFLLAGIVGGYALHRRLTGNWYRTVTAGLLMVSGMLVLLPLFR